MNHNFVTNIKVTGNSVILLVQDIVEEISVLVDVDLVNSSVVG